MCIGTVQDVRSCDLTPSSAAPDPHAIPYVPPPPPEGMDELLHYKTQVKVMTDLINVREDHITSLLAPVMSPQYLDPYHTLACQSLYAVVVRMDVVGCLCVEVQL